MSGINDGGPAFPISDTYHGIGNIERGESGMTIRDYFASRAMQGLIAQSDGTALHSDPEIGALYAYRMADAMLKARKGEQP